jgi:AcrR family transcriptional regulator
MERGFDAVTIAEIAEIAEAAEVSVNTVYNYFPATADLFLDRSRGVVDRLSRYVRGRDAGESTPSCVNCGSRWRASSGHARPARRDGGPPRREGPQLRTTRRRMRPTGVMSVM